VSAADTSGAPAPIEHRYPEGNRLTLVLLGSLTSHEDPRTPGCVVVSVYEASGCADITRPYLVRGHVVTFDARDTAERERVNGVIEGRLANCGGGVSTLEYAWVAARNMFEQLQAAHAALSGVGPNEVAS